MSGIRESCLEFVWGRGNVVLEFLWGLGNSGVGLWIPESCLELVGGCGKIGLDFVRGYGNVSGVCLGRRQGFLEFVWGHGTVV